MSDGLVEKVRGIIETHIAACEPPEAIARAAITAVAEWSLSNYYHGTTLSRFWSDVLFEQEQPK